MHLLSPKASVLQTDATLLLRRTPVSNCCVPVLTRLVDYCRRACFVLLLRPRPRPTSQDWVACSPIDRTHLGVSPTKALRSRLSTSTPTQQVWWTVTVLPRLLFIANEVFYLSELTARMWWTLSGSNRHFLRARQMCSHYH